MSTKESSIEFRRLRSRPEKEPDREELSAYSSGNRAHTAPVSDPSARTDPDTFLASCNGTSDLRRAAEHWLPDGEGQGGSERTVTDRRQTLERFRWWLENEQDTTPTLAALTSDNVRAYLVYAQRASPHG